MSGYAQLFTAAFGENERRRSAAAEEKKQKRAAAVKSAQKQDDKNIKIQGSARASSGPMVRLGEGPLSSRRRLSA